MRVEIPWKATTLASHPLPATSEWLLYKKCNNVQHAPTALTTQKYRDWLDRHFEEYLLRQVWLFRLDFLILMARLDFPNLVAVLLLCLCRVCPHCGDLQAAAGACWRPDMNKTQNE
eukprot:2739795-Amphidinium_carterae.1